MDSGQLLMHRLGWYLNEGCFLWVEIVLMVIATVL